MSGALSRRAALLLCCGAALSTSSACLTEYTSGTISCTPGGAPCPDGFACLDPQGADEFACVRSGCGDGQVDPGSATPSPLGSAFARPEQCDDANDNADDLCDRCRTRQYVADPVANPARVIGFGPGAAVPEDTSIGRPIVVTASSDGTLFIGSVGTNLITRLEPPGVATPGGAPPSASLLTSFAGNGSLASVESALPTAPNQITTVFASSMAVDGLGNLFVSMLQPSVIRRIDALTGAATIVAGNEIGAPGGDDVVGDQTSINLPKSLAVDGDGNVFFVESAEGGIKRIRRLDRVSGRLTTVLGDLNPRLTPDAIAFDGAGDLYALNANAEEITAQTVTPTNVERDVDHSIAIARVRGFRDGGAPDVLRLEVLSFSEHQVFDTQPNGENKLVDAETFFESGCKGPNTAQQRFAVSPDGGHVYFPAGFGFFEITLPDEGSAEPATCERIGEAPPSVEDGSRFGLEPSDVALDGDAVLFADPGNGVVWRLLPGSPSTPMKEVAGILRPPGEDAFNTLVNDIVLEFAKETDAHLVVGFTEACNPTEEGEAFTFELDQLEFFGALPELHRVLLSDCSNRVTVLAGTGIPGFSGDGGPSITAQLSRPSAAVRGQNDDRVYIADRDNNRIRRVTFVGAVERDASNIETFIGPGSVAPFGSDARTLRLDRPSGMAIDDEGRLLVSNTGQHKIQRIDVVTGEVTTVMGTGEPGNNGDAQLAAETQLNEPASLVFLPFAVLASQLGQELPPGGMLIVVERGGNRVRATILSSGAQATVFTIAGDVDGAAGDRDDPVDGKNARFFRPRGLMLAPPAGGDLQSLGFFIVDSVDRVREMSLAAEFSFASGLTLHTTVKTVTSVIDGVGAASRDDGDREVALFRSPTALAVLGVDRILVVDRITGRLRLVTPSSGLVRTVAGMPDGLVPGATGVVSPVPVLEAAPLRGPAGMALDFEVDPPALYVSESAAGQEGGGALRRFSLTDPDDPSSWTTDVVRLDIDLTRPGGLAIDAAAHALYVADTGGQVVVRVDLDSLDQAAPGGSARASVVVGAAGRRGATDDGFLAGTLLNEPEGVAVFNNGRSLLVADTGNNRVRRVDFDGDGDDDGPIISTILGDGDAASGGEGAPAASFPVQRPRGLALDRSGNLLVTSTTAIRFVQAGDDRAPDGNDDVRTIYGKPPRQRFPEPVTRCLSDVALSSDGEAPALYAVDACLGVLLRLDRVGVDD